MPELEDWELPDEFNPDEDEDNSHQEENNAFGRGNLTPSNASKFAHSCDECAEDKNNCMSNEKNFSLDAQLFAFYMEAIRSGTRYSSLLALAWDGVKKAIPCQKANARKLFKKYIGLYYHFKRAQCEKMISFLYKVEKFAEKGRYSPYIGLYLKRFDTSYVRDIYEMAYGVRLGSLYRHMNHKRECLCEEAKKFLIAKYNASLNDMVEAYQSFKDVFIRCESPLWGRNLLDLLGKTLSRSFDKMNGSLLSQIGIKANYSLEKKIDVLKTLIRVGVEVEFKPPQHCPNRVFREYFSEEFPEYTIKSDGSVCNGDGLEINSPILKYNNEEDWGIFKQCINYLKAEGCKPHSSAGIHIHLSLSGYINFLNSRTMTNLYLLSLKFEDVIYRLSSSGWTTHRGRRNGFRYCKPISRMNYLENLFNCVCYNDIRNHPDINRYYGLNTLSYSEHSTIEFRFFNSSLNYDRIVQYVEMAVHMLCAAICLNKEKILKLKTYPLGYVVSLPYKTRTKRAISLMNKFLKMLKLEDKIDYLVSTSNWQHYGRIGHSLRPNMYT